MLRFRAVSSIVCLAGLCLTSAPAAAATRSFKATLTKVTGCSFAAPSGSASVVIDDVTGAVSGTLTIAGFEGGAVVSSSGIHNKNAGDNLVGAFDGVATNAPNATHAVTTTLNAIALPKILAGDGAVIVKSSSGTNCTAGAIRGDLVLEGASGVGDAGADASVTPAPSSDGGSGTPAPGPAPTPADGGANTPPTDGGDPGTDSGCSQSGRGAPGRGMIALGLLGAALVAAGHRRARRPVRATPR